MIIQSKIRFSLTIIFSILVTGLLHSQETLIDGIDNDNDGYVDCFDSDLFGMPGCEPFYFGQPIPECREKPPVLSSYTLVEKFRTDNTLYPIDQRSGVFVGDMTDDGTPDIVSKHPGTGRLYIFNGIDGSLEQEFNQASNSNALNQPAIGDVDGDGWGDVFVVETDNFLKRYEYNNSLSKGSVNNAAPAWTSSDRIDNNIQSPQLADFNGDGTPEVYVGNAIFNAIDGTRLVAYNTGNNGGEQSGRDDAWPHAYNVFNQGDLVPGGGGATFGTEADGLEFIAGNQIYFVDLGNGTQDNGSLTLAQETTISGVTNGDGYTSVADLNGDNRIDVIVTGKTASNAAVIFAYDPYTNQQIGTTYDIGNGSSYAGRVNVADFDSDGDVEIGTAGKNIYVVVEYNSTTEVLETKWSKTGLDDGSQVTGSTVFDFEGDGTAEVVYSEEENLFVWKGSDGSEMAKITSRSGTRTDYPLVADVDGDGQSEIVITAQTGNGPGASGSDWVSVYRSKDAPWLPARESWNQHGYHVTNLGQDLTIPADQQLIVDPSYPSAFNRAFNGFLVQTTFLTQFADPTFAVGDLTTENVIVDTLGCGVVDSVTFTVTLENNGDWKAPRYTPLAIFDGDPYVTTATYLGTIYTQDNVEKGGSLDITHTVKADGSGNIELYVLVNHYEETLAIGDALPAPLTGVTSPTMECDYVNNVGFIVDISNCEVSNAPRLDLDRDDSGGVTGNGFKKAFGVESGAGAIIVDEDVFIIDDDNTNMASATISLTNRPDGVNEYLQHPSAGSSVNGVAISTYNSSTGVITLTGSASLTVYEDILQEITYYNTLDNATISGINRIVEIQVNDGINSSNIAVDSVLIEYKPTLDLDFDNSSGAAGNNFETAFTENGDAVKIVDADVYIETNGLDIQSVTIQHTNIQDGAYEGLYVIGSLPAGITVTNEYEYSVGTLVLSGAASPADYQTALQRIYYADSSDAPNTTDRVFTIQVTDIYLESLEATTTISVTEVNDAPVVTGPADSLFYNEGAAAVSIVEYDFIVDIDDTDIESAQVSITSGHDNTEDTLVFVDQNGITGSFNASTGVMSLSGTATLAEYQAAIASITYQNTDAIDANPATRTLTITVNDGDLNSNAYTRDIYVNVNPVITSAASVAIFDGATSVMTVTATDPNTGDTQTYSISGGADAADFNINASSGALALNSSADYATKRSYTVEVTATDQGGLTTSQIISVTVNDPANPAPSIGDYTIDIDEDTPNFWTIHDIDDENTGNDTDDNGDAITYSLTAGNIDNIFGINPGNGYITVDDNTNLDYESRTVYYLTINATDGSTSDNAVITVNINNINDNNPLIADSTVSISEADTNNKPVIDVNDVNTSDDTDLDQEALTYSIQSGNTGNVFDIDVNTGEIIIDDNTNLDYEVTKQYVLVVRADDGTFTDDATITVNVTGVNDNNPAISNATVNITENSANTTSVYNVNDDNTSNDTDIDEEDLTYSIVSGNSAGVFTINPSTGEITIFDNTNLDYESYTQFVLSVRADDGANTDDAAITINVNDVVEVVSFTIDGISNVNINENVAYTGVTPNITGSPIGDVTYILGGTDAADFTIDAVTGVVSMVGRNYEAPVDANTNNVYEVTITATDEDGNFDTEDWTVTVDDVAELASFTIDAISDVNINENVAYTSVTPNITGTPIGTVTYSLGGTDAADFTIDAGTGVVSMVARDYENPVDDNSDNDYELTITATDDDGNFDTEDWTVTVDDVVEVASFTIDAISDVNINENTAYTSVTPNITGTPIDTVVYTISGTDAADFTIDATTGDVSMIARNYENPVDDNTNNVYELTITATDVDGNSDSESWTVTVDDVVEVVSFTIDAIADVNINENVAYNSVTPNITGSPIGNITYTLGGADAADFTIDAVTGVVSMVARDYETPVDDNTDNVYEVTITATDEDGNFDTEDWTVTIDNLPETASFTIDAIADVTIDENTTYTSVTPSITGSPIGSLTYTLSGTDAADFTIDAGTGVVSMIGRDYENPVDDNTDNVYEVTITATDDDGNAASESWTVTVQDVVEVAAFSIDAITDVTIDENTAYTSVTPNITGTPIGNVTYTLGGADAADFTIDANTGVVSMVARDYENPVDDNTDNVYEVTITATDDDGNAASESWTVTVQDVVETATFSIDAIADVTIDENTAYTSVTPNITGSPIGNVTYTIGGTDAADFIIDANTGVVSMVARDYENPVDDDTDNVYEVSITATDDDGNTATESWTVTINNLSESSSFTINAIADVVIDENTSYTSVTPNITGTPVGSVTYSLGGTDAADFTIDAATGVVSMVGRDYENPTDENTDNVYEVTIIATDDDGNTASESWTVTVQDVAETATFSIDAIADVTIDENAAYTSVTPNITGTPIGNITYTISGADASDFTIDANTGVVSMVARDYENPVDENTDNTYEITIIATDDDGNTATESWTVTINDITESVNQVPVASDEDIVIEEGETYTGTSLLNNVTDPDGDNLTVNTTPVSGPDNGTLVINPDGSYTYTPDNGFTGSDSFVYQVCDDGTPSECATAAVNITIESSDKDGDGIPNDVEGTDDPDGDGIPSDEDTDSDGDGIPDEDEGTSDTDGDGTPDYKDEDSDNDGIPDEEEGPNDTDGDGTPDYRDTDSDGDTVPDSDEGTEDIDDDGDENYRDTDSDDDGILDGDELPGDCDNDGIPNAYDSDRCREGDIFVPQGFSPNNDSENDYFVIPEIVQYNHVSIQIFNRWGNVIYEQDNYENNWDGRSNVNMSVGTELPTGTYFYLITIHDTNERLTGYVYLNR
jgi:gliding motility-associated-like protein